MEKRTNSKSEGQSFINDKVINKIPKLKSHTHLQFAPANAKAKNRKRVCLADAAKQTERKKAGG